MNRTKKIAAITTAVCLVACWPLVLGQIVERAIKKQIAEMDNPFVNGKVVDYQRGYLSSHMITTIQLVDPELKVEFEKERLPTSFQIESDISHRFFSVSSTSHLKESASIPLSMTTNTQMNGQTSFDIQTQSWVHSGDTWRLSMSPSKMSGYFTSLKEIVYQLDLPSITLDDSGTQVQLKNVTAQGQGKRSDYFWLGKDHVSIGQASISSLIGQKEKYVFRTIDYQNDIDLTPQQDRLNNHQLISIEQIESPQQQFKKLKLNFSLNQLDLKSLTVLAKNMHQTQEPNIQHAVLEAIKGLIQRGFSLSIKPIDVTLQTGTVHSMIQIDLPEGIKDADVLNPVKVLEHLTGKITSDIPDTVATQQPKVSQLVDELMGMNMLAKSDQSYQLDADMKDGYLIFQNGQKIPIVSLFLMF